MGVFNTLLLNDVVCPHCGFKQDWILQFEYSDCWRYEYQLGAKLQWGGNDKGKNVGGKVRVEGIAENDCLNCRSEEVYAAIIVEENQLQSATLIADPLNMEDYFEVVQ